LIEIINKPLLLHLVGYLYYWQMGFNSVFKGLTAHCFVWMADGRTVMNWWTGDGRCKLLS